MEYCDDEEKRLVSMLYGQPQSAQVLGAALRRDPRKVRALIAHLVDDHHLPICSTSANGFWMARNWADIDRTTAHLGSRMIEIQRRIDGLKMAGEEHLGPQMALDLGVAV